MNSTRPHVVRRGFTLVELLAVIVIIGVLASMALYAAARAMVAAKNGLISMDIKQLETDLQNYYSTKQSYPPDMVVVNGVSPTVRLQGISQHLRKMAPRYTGPVPLTPDTPLVSGVNAEQARTNIAAEALVFFLGGYSARSGSTKLLGFRADPSNPFVQNVGLLSQPAGWNKGSVVFDETRLVDLDGDGWYEYLPPKCTVPYAYFNAKTYMNPSIAAVPRCEWPGGLGGPAFPYGSDNASEKFMNTKTFQLIAPGLDNMFSSSEVTTPAHANLRKYPSGLNYTPLDNDNLTNFSERKLEDSIP